MRSARPGSALLALLLGISGPSVYAATEDDKLVAGDAALRDRFGESVAISGPTAVVGAFLDDDAGTNSGSAYYFDCTVLPCVEVSKLTASDGAGGHTFGWSVAVSGTTALVGARGDDHAGDASGSAYYFDLSACGPACTETSKLTASDARRVTFFGTSVAVSGTTGIVGTLRSESAYLFDLSTCGAACNEISKLTASDAVPGDSFGGSVAISGTTVVVGAPLDDDVFGDSGSAYVFDCSSLPCVQVSKLTASDAAARDQFGEAVALSGTIAVVGARNVEGDNTGKAYYFDLSACGAACTETGRLAASDAAEGDLFGLPVAVDGTTAVVGARGDDGLDDGTGDASGAAYQFDLSTCGALCTEMGKLTASDARTNDALGSGVAVSGATALVGAPSCSDCVLPGTGAAYIFKLADLDDDGDGVPNDEDVCPDTVIPESVPSRRLGINRWALTDDDTVFDTRSPLGVGPRKSFTTDDTGGCSCEQIITALGLGQGHERFGCSISAMEEWVALVNP